MMKKFHNKSFFAGLITMALVFSLAVPAAATIGKRTLEADYNDIKIELDGKQITPTDASGNPVEPFTVNGTTYLPVRAIGNALGMSVVWDGKTSTVKIESNGGDTYPECYPDFSIPTLDNIIGPNAFIELYSLDSGDSIAYYYDPSKFVLPAGGKYLEAYEDLLNDYGFYYLLTDGGFYFDNPTSGTTVMIYIDEATEDVVVLVMALPDADRANLLKDARRP